MQDFKELSKEEFFALTDGYQQFQQMIHKILKLFDEYSIIPEAAAEIAFEVAALTCADVGLDTVKTAREFEKRIRWIKVGKEIDEKNARQSTVGAGSGEDTGSAGGAGLESGEVGPVPQQLNLAFGEHEQPAESK